MKNKLWFFFALTTIITWGFWGALSGYQIEHGIPDTIIYILWALSMIPCAIVALIINKGKLAHDWKSIGLGCAVGFLGAGGQLVLFKALTLGPAYIIYPFISMSPVIVILLASLFLKEKTTRWQRAGIVVALIAILFLSYQPNDGTAAVSGHLWIFLALIVLLVWGLQGFTMKFANRSMDAESIFVYMTLTALALIPVAWAMTDPAQQALLTGSGISSAAGVADGVATGVAERLTTGTLLTAFFIQLLNSIGALTLVYAYRYGKAVIVSPMEGLSPMATVLISLIISAVIPTPTQIIGFVLAAFAMYALAQN